MGKSYGIQNFMTNVDVALDKKQALTQLGLKVAAILQTFSTAFFNENYFT